MKINEVTIYTRIVFATLAVEKAFFALTDESLL